MGHKEHEWRGHVLSRWVRRQALEEQVSSPMLDGVEGFLFKQELFALLSLNIIVLKRQGCDH